MDSYFSISFNDPHAIFFAGRMAVLVFMLMLCFVVSFCGTWLIADWWKQQKMHRQYIKTRDQKREQHVRELRAQRHTQDDDTIVYSIQSCTKTMPDGLDAGMVQEAIRGFH